METEETNTPKPEEQSVPPQPEPAQEQPKDPPPILEKLTDRSFGFDFRKGFLSGTLILVDNRPNNPQFLENFYLYFDGVEYDRIEKFPMTFVERAYFDTTVRKIFATK
jgi:hypothetical protein